MLSDVERYRYVLHQQRNRVVVGDYVGIWVGRVKSKREEGGGGNEVLREGSVEDEVCNDRAMVCVWLGMGVFELPGPTFEGVEV